MTAAVAIEAEVVVGRGVAGPAAGGDAVSEQDEMAAHAASPNMENMYLGAVRPRTPRIR